MFEKLEHNAGGAFALETFYIMHEVVFYPMREVHDVHYLMHDVHYLMHDVHYLMHGAKGLINKAHYLSKVTNINSVNC